MAALPDKDDQDAQDFEDILEKAYLLASTITLTDHAVFLVDETRMGSSTYSHGRTRRRSSPSRRANATLTALSR